MVCFIPRLIGKPWCMVAGVSNNINRECYFNKFWMTIFYIKQFLGFCPTGSLLLFMEYNADFYIKDKERND